MPSHQEIYIRHADEYELLVSREDYQGNILRAINQICRLDGLDVVELGAGTGRLTCMLAPTAKRIRAFDASGHMLAAAAAKLERYNPHNWQVAAAKLERYNLHNWQVAAAKLERYNPHNWQVAVADHRALPVADQSADVAISGWSICYLVVDRENSWQRHVNRTLAEINRTLRPGGIIIILETLGTGYESPTAPAQLAPYYAFLEEQGFSSTWIRTDYQFESLAEAQDLVGFFFGETMAQKVVRENWVVLPECTGIWWLVT
jgi:ubiquinone/menaquinone biosynthesis C-methylase UbiE